MNRRPLLTFCLSLVGLLAVLFLPSFHPDKVFFANDGPLGAIHSAAAEMPKGFVSQWYDLNSIGGRGPTGGVVFPSFTSFLLWALGPLGFAKFYPPIVLLLLGLFAWTGFRLMKLSPLPCYLGGLAAALNSLYFSSTAWGVGPQAIAAGLSILAVGLLYDRKAPWYWLRVALAGFAVGMGVSEGFDVGALYSLGVAAFLIFQSLVMEAGPGSRIVDLAKRLALVVTCAGILAIQPVVFLVKGNVLQAAGMAQDTRTKQERWDWATQWSLPKAEGFSLLVPGLFGYRMDTPRNMPILQDWYEGGVYWGAGGRDPEWDRYFASGKQGQPPARIIRFGGGGVYMGITVVLIAIWAGARGLRKKDSVFPLEQKKFTWFLSGTLVVSLLLAFGRHFPLFVLLYQVPGASLFRNPVKFIQVFTFALLILFALGVDAFCRVYFQAVVAGAAERSARLKGWWEKASPFDKWWVRGSGIALGVSLLGWLIYSASRTSLEEHLQTVQFDAGMAKFIAGCSIRQFGWFIPFLAAAAWLVVCIISGRFSGTRATLGKVLLGGLLVLDLGRANLPWLVFWDYKMKYATNPVIDFLREKPYEHRAAMLPFPAGLFSEVYQIEWKQHHFQYYNIQSLDVVQMPRIPADLSQYETALALNPADPKSYYRLARKWQLTNNRYLLGPGAPGMQETLNQQLDPGRNRFRVVQKFDIVAKEGIANVTQLEQVTAALQPNGQFAIYEFTGALPRASLYANWQVSTNDDFTLGRLAAPDFDPLQTVFVAGSVPAASGTNVSGGTVEYTSYSPNDLALKANTTSASVLLLNDKYDSDWKVVVDGKPAELLRCNFIMRGVYLAPGTHTVEFHFRPAVPGLYVSLTAMGIAVLLAAFLMVSRPRPAVA
jgi:hypothetical protein